MRGNVFLAIVLLMGTASLGSADEEMSYETALDLVAVVEAYEEGLVADNASGAHLAEVHSWLNSLGDRILVGDNVSNVTWLVAWDFETESLIAVHSNGVVPIQQSSDAFGRITFASATMSGWIDVEDGYLHAAVEVTGQGEKRFTGDLSEALNAPETAPPAITVKREKECVCKGTLERHGCQDPDCRDSQYCSYEKGGRVINSRCMWAYTPVKRITRQEDDSGSTSYDVNLTEESLTATPIIIGPPVIGSAP